MSDQPQPDIASQFREMGDNLKNILRATWESEEAQMLKQELKTGLTELSKAAKEAVDEFKVSEAGQRLKADAEDFKSRVETGEVEAKAREEISAVLNFINSELGRINGQQANSAEDAPSDDESEG